MAIINQVQKQTEYLKERVLVRSDGPDLPSMECVYSSPNLVPTMLFQRELNYLKWCASQVQGKGNVIDLGCFLGGSTSALLSGLREDLSVISYDAFESPDSDYPLLVKLLKQFDLKPGTRFLDEFMNFTQAWTDRIKVRDGWLPEYTGIDVSAGVYEEQSPIELLFCDIAKTWNVHLTVLHSFCPHLLPNATLIQQDFFDLQTPWIPIHMWQLRDAFVPLDVIHGTSSASFRCVGQVKPLLDSLWLPDHDPIEIENSWEMIIEYWSGFVGSDAAQVFHGHAFQLASMQGRYDDAVSHGRAFEAWSRTRQSLNRYISPCWNDLLLHTSNCLPEHLARPHPIDILAAESIARGPHSSHINSDEYSSYYPTSSRMKVWSFVLNKLRSSPRSKRALFGAGMHTTWLLDHFKDEIRECFEFIFDDHPKVDSLYGIPVLHTEQARDRLREVTCVYPSSDAYECEMIERLEALQNEHLRYEIHRIYTAPEHTALANPKCEYIVQTGVPIPDAPPHPEHCLSGPIPLSASHREALSMKPQRSWVMRLSESSQAPEWCTGHLLARDCAFVWDFVESIRPKVVAEIGTAGGVSTATLLHALDVLCEPDATLYTFDIATQCFFDRSRPLASAVNEMAPALTHRLRCFAGSNATDASGMFDVGSIDLLLIDGEHANPAPAADLLCLVYAMRPHSWVILHDIELHNMMTNNNEGSWNATGPGTLFHAWPFNKVQMEGDSPMHRNIGAIQLPDHPVPVIESLLQLLSPPWESQTPSVNRAKAAHTLLESLPQLVQS